ncbi:MAG: rhomboid family intramembrane serine protease [Rubritalea sp.]|uniref:rhomboid family intramembrane serine protease n=1 Tax=Rubritalea sp. TaxID=2109375 RepID=UPI0032426EA9
MFNNRTGNQTSSRFAGAPVTKWLLICNVAIYVLDIFGVGANSFRLRPYGAFEITACFDLHQYWRLLSFQFLHGSPMHLLFNMYAIYMFGGMVERVLGSKRFSAYYLLCGVGGALFYSLLAVSGWLEVNGLVGASAGIFGILVALIVIAPDMQVMLLFPPIPMKMKTFGIFILGIGIYTVLTTGNNAGGEAGHLGGALLGFVLMKNPKWLNWVDGLDVKRVTAHGPKTHYQPKIRPRTAVNMESSEVDRILDKVTQNGIHSLSEEERATLLRISKKD